MDQDIFLLGFNHRTAAVAVREKYALTTVENFTSKLARAVPAREVMCLSTCNRVEILAVGRKGSGLRDAILDFWAKACGGRVEELAPHVYRYEGHEAVGHLFKVAASLDSMIVGEPQILGQLKTAYRDAVDQGSAKVIINRLLHKAFFAAKRVRTETNIASSAVSISFAAVELARKIFGDMTGVTAMLVGAGEMAELAATHLLGNGVKNLLIANRTFARAEELAKTMGGKAITFEEIIGRLAEADIVISSTGAQHTVIQARDVRPVLKKRKNRPMFFIDIAVPRDIDPDVNGLDNVYLYDIDDLKEIVEENMAQRRGEAVKAEALVDIEAEAFGKWLESLGLQPTILDLYGRAERCARQELKKTLKRLGPVPPEAEEALETLVLSLSRKILHEPVDFLKRRTREEGKADEFISLVRRVFNLDDDSVPADAHADRLDDSVEQGSASDPDTCQ